MEMTVREAARHLGVTEKTIRAKIKRGEIQVTRQEPFSGGFRYILEVELGEKPEKPVGEPVGGPGVEILVDLLKERDQRIRELQERLEETNRYWGVDRGRLQEVEKQILLLTGPRPALVERIRKAILGR